MRISRTNRGNDAKRVFRRTIVCVFSASVVCIPVGCDQKKSTPAPPPRVKADSNSDDPQSASLRFDDVTASSGLISIYRNGKEAKENAILESLGGGVGLLDFDCDGNVDFCLPNGGSFTPDRTIVGAPTKLFRQSSPLKFHEVGHFARLDSTSFYTHGCAIADADSDGFPDIVVTGYGGLSYFHNLGDGTFEECSGDVGLVDDLWSSSAAWGDFNQDGILDLYVAHYVDWSWEKHPKCTVASASVEDICSPHQFNGLSDTIFLATEDGRFVKQQQEMGLVSDGKGLGVIAADVDLDGDLDIYVANDTTNNFFYINDGKGKFSEVGLESGLATDANGIPNGSMGLAVFDANNDLLPDVWVTNYENETFGLYENVGDANFNYISQLAGVTALGTLYVGFGTVATDFDQDGDEDICVANGHVINYPKQGTPSQKQLLLVNNGRRFSAAEFEEGTYFSREHMGRSVVTADLDQDGKRDLVFANTNEQAALLRNSTTTTGAWLSVELVGTSSNRNGIGAHVIARTGQGELLRCVVGGGSYLSQSTYELHWGFPESSRISELVVSWPSGQVQTVSQPAMNQKHRIVEAAQQIVEPRND